HIGVTPLGDASAVATCVARSFGCAATAIVRSALPLVDDELGRFGLVLDDDPLCPASNPAPTATASASPTVTTTPAVSATPTTGVTGATTTATETPAAPTPSPTPSATPSATPTEIATLVPTATPTPSSASGCGDGILEPGEQCDFGDTLD